MKQYFALAALSLIAACGRPESARSLVSTDLSSTMAVPAARSKVTVRPMAEYEKTDDIILSAPLIEGDHKIIMEYQNMMLSLLGETQATISFYTVYRNDGEDRFYRIFPALLPYESRIVIRPLFDEFLDFPIAADDDFGSWMRDASPIPGIDTTTGKPILFDLQYGEKGEVPLADSVPQHYAKAAGLPLIDVPMVFEGGNLMATTQGTCAISWGITGQNSNALPAAERDRILKETMGCTSIIFLKEIPGAIEHSDMIAKFLDDNTVAVTDFTDDRVYFSGDICESSDEVDCKSQDWGIAQGYYDTQELGRLLRAEGQKRFGKKFMEGEFRGEGEALFVSKGKAQSLKALSEEWKAQFRAAGFKIVSLPTPAPTVRFYLSGNDIKYLYPEMEYVTYANALIFEQKIFVPSYQYDERIKAANGPALEAYRDAGWKVVPIETSELTIGREGSIHCMSMSLRTKD